MERLLHFSAGPRFKLPSSLHYVSSTRSQGTSDLPQTGRKVEQPGQQDLLVWNHRSFPISCKKNCFPLEPNVIVLEMCEVAGMIIKQTGRDGILANRREKNRCVISVTPRGEEGQLIFPTRRHTQRCKTIRKTPPGALRPIGSQFRPFRIQWEQIPPSC